ncbi:hypothetical protein BKA58DRAFT_425050 [Alternaria rosae]|uniref:uncharacterized protein n=1 Tax=Alternaria rosae TaxID=1187941 RepID=UPI001E8D3DA0|nr:uncharacterized protein BKA58DRAFT_425050 [Alternaria rosae]KAH6851517.1 hypothetical protein BKA58DRAFT_425050 [Alternaria rosae]
MPHSTQYSVLAPATPPTKTLATQNGKARSNGFMSVHERKDLQQARALNPFDPIEVDGTPMNECSTAIPSECELEEAETNLWVALKQYKMLLEAKMDLSNAFDEYKDLFLIHQRRKGNSTSHLDIAIPETQDNQLVEAAQDALAKAPPPPAKPDPVSYDKFIQTLEQGGYTWLLKHTKHLNSMDDFAVALTADPKQKRCKVGRPRGDLEFRQQVGGQGRDPWKCWPPNADEDVEVATE